MKLLYRNLNMECHNCTSLTQENTLTYYVKNRILSAATLSYY